MRGDNLKIKLLGVKGTWREIANSANTTINYGIGTKEPSIQWKRRMLRCEHSPIRQMFFKFKWYDLMSWVSVHFVRHKIGIEHWVRSQRSDRSNTIDRNISQENFIEHEFEANIQAIINISRKRLCNNASKETREAWGKVLEKIYEIDEEIGEVCVQECIYRGWCYEFKSCGYHLSDE